MPSNKSYSFLLTKITFQFSNPHRQPSPQARRSAMMWSPDCSRLRLTLTGRNHLYASVTFAPPWFLSTAGQSARWRKTTGIEVYHNSDLSREKIVGTVHTQTATPKSSKRNRSISVLKHIGGSREQGWVTMKPFSDMNSRKLGQGVIRSSPLTYHDILSVVTSG